jgi:hypothetical protein
MLRSRYNFHRNSVILFMDFCRFEENGMAGLFKGVQEAAPRE